MPFDPSSHPDLGESEARLVRNITDFTRQYFDDPRFDASHDFNHVLRVTAIATKILAQKPLIVAVWPDSSTPPRYSTLVVILAALLHDVDDKKYVDVSAPSYVPRAKQELLQQGASEELASQIQTLIEAVSYSTEVKDPGKARDVLVNIPELAIVQDADRLDALGAVGIGRCFAYGAAKGARSLDNSIDHFDDKLFKLEGKMKTQTGRDMAREYANRIKTFRSWWVDECSFAGAEI